MATFALRRTLQALPLLALLSVVLFALVRLTPGGPLAQAERNPNVTAEQLARLRERLGLDQPLPVQYARWIGDFVLVGDWGTSIRFNQPVFDMIAERLPNTIVLVGAAFFLTLVIAIPIGVISAQRPGSWFDNTVTTLSFAGQAVPPFWLGLMLILIFYGTLENPLTGGPLFPAGGMTSPNGRGDLGERLWHLTLPAVALAAGYVAWYSRFMRSTMRDVLNEPYVRTARAKGLIERLVTYRHALRNGLLPLVTMFALDLPAVFSGALFIENIFAWPGMGRLFWDAARNRDYPILLAVVMINAALIVAFNILADVIYGLLDPRIRYD
jgi:peptide/nickel transport system permease protein